ncbi:pyridoxal phosphate-dependent aminotransferase family protein [Tenacibaculum finnmarkense]|uniref:aminotransferase class I/II-fold pyridoxal phosphate-dependent enzyme n=1 Tax=Tenacibaculum finnmarkense TaxID=2781243 RepID=UPI001E5873B2|nr:pyridoxal phosphate-dependent aminotransferase family protein [Tenacibaculum finnmarkense]MCD8400289.1 pyridoxal phosphate-dependent aminotransferase family protein [Tenacibaculum finnmarkense genomovar ulcerans]MCG8785730.1 pyridoxal phosphate-dependent aminotransferase family protein [Tenacibaculum finnmarkense]MCG8795733.1 pyridoxal phosphate-dependent aminotransferase family protein [Tenacibaculum finnmarkense]MCG8797905.1 pyridoxal phosphate-dependent aminotransferase family protein [Te
MQFPKKLSAKLLVRTKNQALRTLDQVNNTPILIDFSSNDYLGFAKSEVIFNKTHQFLVDNNILQNGATGSRLLSGNHPLYNSIEKELAEFHHHQEALIFNSGYDANIGFFSSVPQRGDIILYDEFIHASIRDGIQLSNAQSFKFKHNNLEDLDKKISKHRLKNDAEIYVVTEAVFSMDGDAPDLIAMSEIIQKNNVHFIIDEAHAVGVFNKGLVQELKIENAVFARIITFGKAMGCHGAVILTSKELKQYLVNFSRSFIYTTGLSPHSLATIKFAYSELISSKATENLQENILFFKQEINRLQLHFIASNSAIHCCIISGNENVKAISKKLQEKGFDVKAILSPTVNKGEERLRFCLHSYNSFEEITAVLEHLATFV